MLSAAGTAGGANDISGVLAGLGGSGNVASSAADSSAGSTLSGLDAYTTNAMLGGGGDDLFASKAKTPKLELPTSNFFDELSPGGANPGSVMNSGMNDNSPASSSSSLAAAAAALMQATSASNSAMNNMMMGQTCNGLSGRANSLSLDDRSAMGGMLAGNANRQTMATTSLGGSGGSDGGDSMQPRQRRKVPEGELCAVCSDRATGYHYGVASCNGCKTFFRRTIVSDHQFVCQYQGKCDVNKNVRCACRYCRFQKCVAVGMDQRAIQNDRDRIGPTKKFRLGLMGANGGSGGMLGGPGSSGALNFQLMTPGSSKRNGSMDEDQLSAGSTSPTGAGGSVGISPQALTAAAIEAVHGIVDEGVIKHLVLVEELSNKLRNCVLDTTMSIRETLRAPSLLFKVSELEIDPATLFSRLYPAALNDIQMWNVRELKLCLEWAKTFQDFTSLTETNQFFLLRHVAFAFNIMNRVYYSIDHGPEKIVFPTGAFITREPQEEVLVPGCRAIYQRQMDEIMTPFRRMGVTMAEFATFKAILFFNPDALNLSPDAKPGIALVRDKYLKALFYLLINNHGLIGGMEKFANMLMMAPSIQNIINQNDENMQVMEVFGNFWRIHGFVKELCLSTAPKAVDSPPPQDTKNDNTKTEPR